MLVHDDGVDVGELAQLVWYPLWDSGAKLDHAVRSLPEMLDQAGGDLKVALGLLDLRHLAGDPNLTLRLRATRAGRLAAPAPGERLPELQRLVRSRHELVGELAHLSVPDLKEAAGGVRDATVLKALVATWLVDVPHGELERCRLALLDVRDVVQDAAGRATDRVAPELWDDVAEGLELADARAAQVHVRELGRRITHLSRLTWRRVDDVLARPTSARLARRPALAPVAAGVALAAGEVVLDARARPARGPRAAAARLRRRRRARRPAGARHRRPPGPRVPRRWASRGPPRPGGCWSGCSPPGAACCRSGRRSRRPARCRWSCPSGSGSGCCRTPR